MLHNAFRNVPQISFPQPEELVCVSILPSAQYWVPAVQYPGRSLSAFQVGRGICEPLSNRFETRFALHQWVLFGEGHVLCIIDGGDLGCIKNMGGHALVGVFTVAVSAAKL